MTFRARLERAADTFALAGVAGLLILAAVVVYDAVAAKAGGRPVPGLNELVAMFVSASVAACMPAGVLRKAHLRVEVLERWLPRRSRLVLDRLAAFGLLLFLLIIAAGFAEYAITVSARGQVSQIVGAPLSAFYGFVAVSFGVAAGLQGFQVSDTLKLSAEPEGRGRVLSVAALGGVLIGLTGLGVIAVAGAYAGGVGLEAVTLGLVAITWVLILGGIPVGAVLGLAGAAGVAFMIGPWPAAFLSTLELTPYLESEQFAVLPLFLMMGSFAGASGLATDFYTVAQRVLRRAPGGLAIATIFACAGFGAVTGSSLATLATLGRVALPEMRKAGYPDQLSTGALAAGGTLGMLIPPSGILILYALLTEVSIGKMFMAAIIPAAISVVGYSLIILLRVKLQPADVAFRAPVEPEPLRRAVVGTLISLGVGAITLGGLYSGLVTVLQAAAVGLAVIFLLALWRGVGSGGTLPKVLSDTVVNAAMIYLLIFGGVIFSYFAGLSGVVEAFTTAIGGLHLPRYGLIAVLVVAYLFLGTLIDPIAALVITAPIVAPLVMGAGFDPVWWGVILIILVETGMLHPPMGINVFILKGIAGDEVRLGTIFRGVLPFVLFDLLKLLLLIAAPALVLWLPQHM